MTTCDPGWIAALLAIVFLVGMTGAPSLGLAWHGERRGARWAIGGALAFALVGIAFTAIATWRDGPLALTPLAYLPAALGCAWALLRFEAPRIRAALLATGVTFAILVAITLGVVVDVGADACPRTA